MRVHIDPKTDTNSVITITATAEDLGPLKEHVLKQFRSRVKVPGFREGKAPLNLIEKHVDQALLQSEFLEEAINHLYSAAINNQKIRPVSRPQVEIRKYVPFTDLEFTAAVEVVGDIKLANYKKIKKTLPKVSVGAKDVTDVLKNLQTRAAKRSDVDRAAKQGDEVIIDFEGKDQKGNPIAGAAGKDYPLLLGSGSFIPGFEDNLVGLKAGQQKDFSLTFPKDYGVTAMQGKKVTFSVSAKQVQELVEPKLDDAFAKQAGPFKSLAELKADIKKQVTAERQSEAERQFENELVGEIVDKSQLFLPANLVEEQAEILMRDLQQNLAYRGLTFQEFLKAEGQTEAEYRTKVLKPQAQQRVKAGLVLSEISDQEQLNVTEAELDHEMKHLQDHYKDDAMQAELAKPEARRDIASRILTQKTVKRLVDLATK